MTVFEALCRAARVHQAPVLLIDVQTELRLGGAEGVLTRTRRALGRALEELVVCGEARRYHDAEKGRWVYWPEPVLMAEPLPLDGAPALSTDEIVRRAASLVLAELGHAIGPGGGDERRS